MAKKDAASKRPAEAARAYALYTINRQRAFGDLLSELKRAYGQPGQPARDAADTGSQHVRALLAVADFLDQMGGRAAEGDLADFADQFVKLAQMLQDPNEGVRAPMLYPATTKPDPAAVMAVLKALESKLSNAFEEAKAKADPTNFYVVALTAVANFLEKSDVKNEVAHKFIELASFIHEGSLPFLRPPKASGRTYDSQTFWVHRAYAVIGLECILRSEKMNMEDGAKYIAKKYPVFSRLKRNPSHSLAKSIISWRRYYNEGRGYEYVREEMAKHYEPRPPDKMFEYAEAFLQKAAKIVDQAVLGRSNPPS